MNRVQEQFRALIIRPITWVLVLGLAIRIYACLTTYIINPDGIHYIHQARAIFYQDWSSLTSCHLKYLSILPILIVAAYSVLQDWIIAGLCVSTLFGFATLFPLYFLLRRFFDETLSSITLLIFVLIPFFVSRSANVLRDPVFWFFIASGMLLFLRQWDEPFQGRRDRYSAVLSSLCFLLATWARVEGVMFFAVSAGYLLIASTDRRLERLFFFLSPVLVLGIAAFAGILLADSRAVYLQKINQIPHELVQAAPLYETLRDEIETLAAQNPGYVGKFLYQVRKIAWLVPFGLVFTYIIKALSYPYAFIFFLGCVGMFRRVGAQQRMGYLLWLSFFSILVLCVHLIATWHIYNRFLAILILPGCVVMGLGVDNVIRFLQQRLQIRQRAALLLLLSFILLFGLTKNLSPNEKDKVIYRQAAEIIARHKAPQQVARIAAQYSNVYEWVFFYAHLDYPGTLCARPLCGTIGTDYEQFLLDLKENGIRYVLFEEKVWPVGRLDLKAAPYERDFRLLGKWHHKSTGDLLLLERLSGENT
ncbi:MAG: ArnT family glycosyltransferase [Desulfatiglandales bacterium]